MRASINGHEINEQLLLKGSKMKSSFLGWLESHDGTKRVKFTFPVNPRETHTVQVGVFEASPAEPASKAAEGAARPPSIANGESFSGPPVSNARFLLGEPVAIAQVQLRAEV